MEKIKLSNKSVYILFIEKIIILLVSLFILILVIQLGNIKLLKKYKDIVNIIIYFLILWNIILSLSSIISPIIISRKTYLVITKDYIEYTEGGFQTRKTYIPIKNMMQIETSTSTISNIFKATSFVFSTSFLTIKTKPFDQEIATKIVSYLMHQQGLNHEG
ncbi:MAG: hypothetical protein ACRCTA_06825 [Bacilli bacterium]